jgi:hypothetical protein
VASPADGAAHRPQGQEHQTDDEDHDPDDPEDLNFQQETDNEKNDSENDHGRYLISVGSDGAVWWATQVVAWGVSV